MKRIARMRVVALTIDFAPRYEFWLDRGTTSPSTGRSTPDRAPGLYELAVASSATIEPVPVPHDCVDGFGLAFWRRPDCLPRSQSARRDQLLSSARQRHVQRAMKQLGARSRERTSAGRAQL